MVDMKDLIMSMVCYHIKRV